MVGSVHPSRSHRGYHKGYVVRLGVLVFQSIEDRGSMPMDSRLSVQGCLSCLISRDLVQVVWKPLGQFDGTEDMTAYCLFSQVCAKLMAETGNVAYLLYGVPLWT